MKYGFERLREQLYEHIDGEWEWESKEDWGGDTQIEKLLLLAIIAKSRYNATEYSEILIPRSVELESRLLMNIKHHRTALVVRPQAGVGNRIVDFLVHAVDWRCQEKDWRWRRLIIECDGHDFHERTKEQAARDRAKDRAALLSGQDQLRFTGSEIWRDPWECATQVFDWAVAGWG